MSADQLDRATLVAVLGWLEEAADMGERAEGMVLWLCARLRGQLGIVD